MITAWTKHIKDEEQKKRFQNDIINSKSVLFRLDELIQEELRTLEKTEENPKVYDLPNWDYRQAHYNGYRQMASVIRKIININDQ
jgi:hypothetical protein